MAVPALTFDYPRASRIGNTSMGVVLGSANVTSYDTAHPAVTALTGKFRPSGILRVIPDGESSGGYTVRWDKATSSFKAYVTAVPSLGLAAAPAGSTIVLGASPATYTNADAVPELIVLTGGTVSSITLTRGGFTSAALATATPFSILLQVGDAITVTYTVAPTVQEKLLVAAANDSEGVDVEVANTTNVGTFDFVAIGQIGS